MSLSGEQCLSVVRLCLCKEAHCPHAVLQGRKHLGLDAEDVLSPCRAVDGALGCAHACLRVLGPYIAAPLGVRIRWSCTCICVQSILTCNRKCAHLGVR